MKDAIKEYLASLECDVTEQQVESMAAYAEILWDTNSHVNLTRHVDIDSFLTRDVRDSVALSAFLSPGDKVLDVGSGGGVPGVLLAILRPDVSVSLAESVRKKADALSKFVSSLELPVVVHHERAEKVVSKTRYDVVTVRAVGSISKLCSTFNARWHRFTRMLALKGPNWTCEAEEASQQIAKARISIECVEQYRIHDGDAQAVILELRRQ